MASAHFRDVRRSDGDLDRFAVSRDLWPGGTLQMWQGKAAPRPASVFWPVDDAQVLAVLEAAVAQQKVVIPYGAGSGVCGGARGREDAWVLDLKSIDRISEVDPVRWMVEAGAGANGQHLEDHLAARGFTCGHSPSSIWCSTVGGWAAARGAGQFSSRYGVFEDMVLGMDVVAPGIGAFVVGEPGPSSPTARAPEAWMPLLLGSEGTLGVITRVRLRVWPQPETRWLRGYRFPGVGSALRAMRQLMQAELWPSVVRLYDPVDTWIGGKTKPKGGEGRDLGFVKQWLAWADELPDVRRRTLALPLSLPGVINRVAGAMATGCLLIVGWEGDPEVVASSVRAGQRLLAREGVDLGEDPGLRWFNSRHAVSYKLMPIFERGGFADTMEVAGSWSALPRIYDAVRAALSKTVVVMAHMSHVYPEGGSIYFSFAGKGEQGIYDATWKAALDAVLASGGTVTHHHGVGSLKAEAVSREIGPAVAGWRDLKEHLDPAGSLNPGRVFVDTARRTSVPAAHIAADDGLISVDAGDDVHARAARAQGRGFELLWAWERLPMPPRRFRAPWQAGWVEVRGRVGDQECVLGRGPRSASGPDLREWLLAHGEDVRCTVGVSPSALRWMGSARIDDPWGAALALLRSDLRPAVLTVADGRLLVGFRGPAADDLGALASSRVPGGLEVTAWRQPPVPTGLMRWCDPLDPDAIAVCPQGVMAREVRHG